MDNYQIRIITVDFCMCPPISGLDVMYSEFRASSINILPILRVFGSTATGEKICVHIHGVFPYIYIPYDGMQDAGTLMHQIAVNVDKAINISLNQASSTNQHVYKISLVSGIPMYGYHTKRHQFFKIFLYNPMFIRKVSTLLLNDSTLGRIYQPHESHLNFTLQFMIDYNLHGMNNMILSELKYRYNPASVSNIDPNLYLSSTIEKTTVCELEADTYAEHIVNRLEIASGNIAVNPGLTAIWADEIQRRRNKGETSQVGSFLELKRNKLPPTKSHLLYKQSLLEKLTVWTTSKTEDKLSDSVYPAETPDDMDTPNASLADFQAPSSMDFSLSDTTIISPDSLDETFLSNQINPSDISMDAEAMNLLDILNELGEPSDEKLEDDSILSQVTKEDDDEKEFDLSMPLEPVTPSKMNIDRQYSESESDNELDKTLIPQLDGTHNDSDISQNSQESDSTFQWEQLITIKNKISDLEDKITPAVSAAKKCSNKYYAIKFDNDLYRKEEMTKMSNLQTFDGARDFSSSSSDEDNVHSKCKRSTRKTCNTDSPKYSALPILISSPKNSKSSSFKAEWQPVPSTICSDVKGKDKVIVQDKKDTVEIEAKRKLDFSTFPDTTIIENKLMCNYTPAKPDKITKYTHRFINNDNKIQLLEGQSHKPATITQSVQKSNNTPKVIPEGEQDLSVGDKSNNSSYVDNIMITEKYDRENNHKAKKGCSTVLTPHLKELPNQENMDSLLHNTMIAEKYDRENNYKAKEGCSTVLTPQLKEQSSQEQIDSSSHNSSFVDNIMIAEKYDRENNYKAKEGCSTVLTPQLKEQSSQEQIDSSSHNSSFVDNIMIAEKYDRENNYKAKEGCSTVLTPQLKEQSSQEQIDSSSHNSSFVDNIMIAEKYDRENNYKAKEGCSTVLTPQLEDLSSQENMDSSSQMDTKYRDVQENKDICSSSESSTYRSKEIYLTMDEECKPRQENKEIRSSSESSSFGLLTPYQCTVVDDNADQIIHKEKEHLLGEKYISSVSYKAPTKAEVVNSLDKFNIPSLKMTEPFYSNMGDVTGNVEIGYAILKINSKTTAHLPEFDSHNDALNIFRTNWFNSMKNVINPKKGNWNQLLLRHCQPKECIITPLRKPPSFEMVTDWINKKSTQLESDIHTPDKVNNKVKIHIPLSPGHQNDDMELSLSLSPCTQNTSQRSDNIPHPNRSPVLTNEYRRKKKMELGMTQENNNSCQITGVTINDTFGFGHSAEDFKEARTVIEHQHLTMLVIELHVRTRSNFKPDPAFDSICAIFYSILNDVPEDSIRSTKCRGIVAIDSLPLSPGSSKIPILNGLGVDCDITYTNSEENLISEFLKLVHYWDPDIFAGYEIEMLSWGYLIERSYVIGLNLKPLLGRSKINTMHFKDEDPSHDIKIVGRIVLDVWRLMRHEIALQSYTFESIVYHILHKRVPFYSFKDLTFWWDHRSNIYRHRTAIYYLNRVIAVMDLFDKLDFIGRTSELARLFGIQFYEVLSRGSQFRVESMMLRLAKPLNFIPVSPSVQQRAHMKAPEYIPLILEPESKLYNDPVIVLDFQSLYPSIIIAYNYCFTTCIGRIEHLGKNTPFEFGATQLKIPRKLLERLMKRDLLHFTPCGVAFVKKKVRDGIMPRMLREILDTRLMVKNSMKENKDNSVLQKVLHSRQLGLKLIANVTYGYTAANFSGRMPSVEVGDSVVSKGRETLQRAIDMVEQTPEWGARVVYGDTDSLFVMVPGKSREQAFEIGKKISEAVTLSNPDPIKLKLEKVYQPCILQTKKRYVGYMYESADQKEAIFEAKGIETVRRDGCPAVGKILEKCLRILFETKDVSLVKKYVIRQFSKILTGRASIQDLTFAKEYRGAAGYRPGACVPALELCRKWTATDKRNEPRSGQRVPYIIVNGSPGLPLIKLVRSPRDLLNDASLRPNALYYITRVIIPPVNRCFSLIGADLLTWFNQMPRKHTQYLPSSVSPEKKSTISQYFSTTSCVCCGEQTQTGICHNCSIIPQETTVILMEKMRIWEANHQNCLLICQSCTSSLTEIKCASLDCPVLYRRIQTNCDVQQTSYIRQLLTTSEFIY